ncbi:MAG TPA: hypothetical protein ENK91_09985, partial [Bacteroidetes bacterium]|nr:hypothetical protein [Bacteroidota bacterium]
NCDMTFGGIYFKLIYPYLLYTINDSIYIDNFENKERLFITDHGYPYFENKKYVLIKKATELDDEEEFYIYNIERRELLKIPLKSYFPRIENEYFVVDRNSSDDHGEWVMDLNLNIIVSTDENYYAGGYNKDVIIMQNKNPSKPVKLFYKNKLIKLQDSIKSFERFSSNNSMVVVSDNEKQGLINKKGELILPIEYDDITFPYNFKLLSEDQIIAKKNNYIYLFNKDLELIFKGRYDDLRILDENRFVVRNISRKRVVDKNNNVIIPYDFLGEDYYTIVNNSKNKLIF